jgi:hypothetical protein
MFARTSTPAPIVPGSTPEEFGWRIAAKNARWMPIIKRLDLRDRL